MKTRSVKLLAFVVATILVLSMAACVQPSASSKAPSTEPSVEDSAAAPESAAPSDAQPAQEITLRIGAAQSVDGFTWIESIKKSFMPKVDEILAGTGNYKINWVEAWGGTVAKTNEMLTAVQSNLLDIGWVGNVFHASQLPLNNISYYIPFNVRVQDGEQMLTAMKAMYEKYPELAGEYEAFDNKILGLTVLESYNIATTFPINTVADLKGKKIGAAGANLNWFANTGATAVQSPGTEAYSSIQTGVYDGTMQHTLMLDTLKLYEVAKYITLGDFGSVWGGSLTINMNVFNGLPQEVQDALVQGGEAYTDGTVALENQKLGAYKADLEAKGAAVSVLSDEQRTAWVNELDNLPKDYAQQLDSQGLKGTEMMKAYIDALTEAGCKLPRQWF